MITSDDIEIFPIIEHQSTFSPIAVKDEPHDVIHCKKHDNRLPEAGPKMGQEKHNKPHNFCNNFVSIDIKEESDDDEDCPISQLILKAKNYNCEASIKQFSFDVRAEGYCSKVLNEVSWDCKKCKPKTSFLNFTDYICHTIQAHQDNFKFQCNVCGEIVSSLADHFDSHSKMSMFMCKNLEASPQNGDTSATSDIAGDVSPPIDDDHCAEFQDADDDSRSEITSQKNSFQIFEEVIWEGREFQIETIYGEDGQKSFKCVYCAKLFKEGKKCAKHAVAKHLKKSPKKRFSSLKSNRSHKESNVSITEISQIEIDKDDLNIFEAEKPKRQHLCSYCGKTFSLSYKLKKHYRVHTGEKPYHCKQCGKNFSSCSNLKRHLIIHSGEKPYLCTFCGKSFNHPTTFKTHSFIHASTKKLKPILKRFSCDFCSKDFAAKSTLIIHERVHTKERPFQCATCSKSFAQKSALNQHLLNHSDEKPHTCSYCAKTFKALVSLKTHERTHTGEKPYKCGVCNKAFSSQSNLYRHRATHTGIKRFSCDYCNKEFSQRSALGDHMNIHTGARPYCCPHCTSSFANKSTLVKHVAIHNMKREPKKTL